MMNLDEILKSTGGKVIKSGKNFYYKSFSIDTRTIKKDGFFIAIKGEIFNGNDFVREAFLNCASVCMVDEIKYDKYKLNDDNWIILVENCREALIQMAAYYRKKLSVTVIGVTGSVGKTSTKDLIAGVLSSKYNTFKTKGNYNNDLGLPLMILSMNETHEVAVLEMGMNHIGEIETLAKILKPDIAVITNIGVTHIENLGTRENILCAKMEITKYFTEHNKLIINGDNDLLSTISAKEYNVITCGFDKKNEYEILKESFKDDKMEFKIKNKLSIYKFEIKGLYGKHSIMNASLAICCGFELGLNEYEIQKGLDNIELTPMRMEINSYNGLTIIDDSYNASPDSMKAAVDVLSSYKSRRKIAVLGTMRELGDISNIMHKEIGAYAKNKADILITFSDYNAQYKEGFGESINCFNNVNDLLQFVLREIKKDDVILIKASRSEKYENIVKMIKNNFCNN